jgi:hypothetical protein
MICIRCASFEIEFDRALRTIATLTAERDAAQFDRELAKEAHLNWEHACGIARADLASAHDDMRALAESARSLTSLWVLRGGDVLSPPAHELLPVLVAMNTVLARPGIKRVMEGS